MGALPEVTEEDMVRDRAAARQRRAAESAFRGGDTQEGVPGEAEPLRTPPPGNERP